MNGGTMALKFYYLNSPTFCHHHVFYGLYFLDNIFMDMKQGKATFTLFIVLGLLFIFLYKRWHEPARQELLNRHPYHLYYTRHALCRMDCRHISREDINEILENGIINLNKSQQDDHPCPTFALQGSTNHGESIRVILAQCSQETKIITCYNLKEDFECHCPGDENKH